MNLKDLAKPMAYKWRIGQVYPTRSGDELVNKFYVDKGMKLATATCLAYIDARQVEDRLDKVCGPENWQDDYKMVGDRMMAGIGIKIYPPLEVEDGKIVRDEKPQWIWKWDIGTSGNFEEEKSEVSDAFKRAAVKWGIGRFLYSMGMEYVDVAAKKEGKKFLYPVAIRPDNHKKIYDLTEYINSKEKHQKRIGGK